jgi:molybdenum cofactor cytidylyltransferase
LSARVAGVILAAGSSTRLGRPKQLLDLDGEPLLRHTIRNALGSRLDEVVVVLGARAAEIDGAVGYLGQRTVVNPSHEQGQSTSMRLGLESIHPDSDAVLFLLGDQPGVRPPLIDALLARYHDSLAPIVQGRFQGKPGNPVLIARSLFSKLAAIEGDEGARSVVAAHRGEISFVDLPEIAVPQDVDTDEDYQALLQSWETA